MADVHPSATIHPTAQLAEDAYVGPYCVVEAGVILGAGCRLETHVTIHSGVTAGDRNVFGPGSVIGGAPQDRRYAGEPTYLVIGDDNVFREYVTIHRATGEGGTTYVGNSNYLMANCHLGHNVRVEDFVTMANMTGVSGHATIESMVTIGGMVGVHQWARIGKVAMVGGFTKVSRDVPPFMLVDGADQEVRDINAVGLRRIGITPESRLALHKACKLLFKSQLGMTNAIATVRREVPATAEVEYLLTFVQRRGKNGRGDQP